MQQVFELLFGFDQKRREQDVPHAGRIKEQHKYTMFIYIYIYIHIKDAVKSPNGKWTHRPYIGIAWQGMALHLVFGYFSASPSQLLQWVNS